MERSKEVSLVIVETDTGEEYEIVLCKDCKYWNKSDNAVWCRRTAIGIFRMEADDFCSKGEKR